MPREFGNNPNGSPTALRAWAESVGVSTADLTEVARNLNRAYDTIQGASEDAQRDALRTLFMEGYQHGLAHPPAVGGRHRSKKNRRVTRRRK